MPATEFALCIPTYRAARDLDALLPALAGQSLQPRELIVVDSTSGDGTAERLSSFGARVVTIPKQQFNHGRTRRLLAELAGDVPLLLYLTQDAIPADPDAFAQIIAEFDDPDVAGAYGRQLPHRGSGGIEAHARLFNYGPERQVRTLADAPRYGIKTLFFSNSFAAYRASALAAVGYFPEDVIFGEDQLAAARLLFAGHKIVYAASAQVYHSHAYSIGEEFRRCFDHGVMHRREAAIIERLGTVGGEGLRFVRSELIHLCRHEPQSIPGAVARTVAKLIGYKLGMAESRLTTSVKRRISLQPSYWAT